MDLKQFTTVEELASPIKTLIASTIDVPVYTDARLTASASATDTTITTNRVPSGGIAKGYWAVIDPWTTECEIREVTSISDTTLTIAALTYGHSIDDGILYIVEPTSNVKWFGAMGDGSTDDTTAVQRAVTDLVDDFTLYFPAGTYIIDSGQLTINKSSVKYQGNFNATLKMKAKDYSGLPATTRYPIFYASSAITNVEISGLRFDGNSTNQTNRTRVSDGLTRVNAICIEGTSTDIIVRNCYIDDFIGEGIRIGNDTGNCERLIISENIIRNCEDMFIDVIDCYDVIISNNDCYDAGIAAESPPLQGNGIMVQRSSGGVGGKIVIEGNIIDTCSRKGIYCELDDATIIGNVVKNCNWASINVSAAAKHATVAGNTVIDSDDAGIMVSSSVADCEDVVISGNYIYDSGADAGSQDHGIYVNDCVNVSVLNNAIQISNDYCIKIDSNTSGAILVEGNYCQSHPTSTTGGGMIVQAESRIIGNFIDTCNEGIRIASTADGSHISGNVVFNIDTGISIRVDGQDCIIANNIIQDGINGIIFNLAYTMGTPIVKDNIMENMSTSGIGLSGATYGNITALIMDGNSYLNCTANIASVLQDNTNVDVWGFQTTGVGRRITEGNAAPSGGTWAIGDVCYDRVPTAGGDIGWVCTTAGTPGTWKTFGDIAA